jgi:putative PIN family toxin of toxin-antitoxin system
MRVVADTNTVVSGLLWSGAPGRIIDAAQDSILELCTSSELLKELDEVLRRPKFGQRLAGIGVTLDELLARYAAVATLVEPAPIHAAVAADPDDDAVIACAVAAQADVIVSGDKHLLDLQQYQNIPILTAAELVQRLAEQRQ